MKVFFNILKIHFESPPQYDFSRKSFIPNLSQSCFFPSYDEIGLYFERIFIGIGIVAIVLSLILSIWTKLDPEFQNLHKPAVNKNDNELSTVRSTLLRTDEAGSLNTSNCHEESVTVEESIARNELE